MKRTLLLIMSVAIVAFSFAQNKQFKQKRFYTDQSKNKKALPVIDNRQEDRRSPTYTSPLKSRIVQNSSRAVTSVALGSSGNLYTMIRNSSNMIAASNALNSVVFIHRNNPSALGGDIGQYRYDVSTDGGMSFTNDQGPYGTGSNGSNVCGRYPQMVLHNPTGNTDPNNAYSVYLGTYHDCATTAVWKGYLHGVGKLDGTGLTENNTLTSQAESNIAFSLVNGKPGEFWTMDLIYDGNAVSGIVVLKGTFNSGTNDVDWVEQQQILIDFDIDYDGTPSYILPTMAFDPTGNIGWIGLSADVYTSTSPDNVLNPVFFKSTDGGTTWNEIDVNLSDYCSVISMLNPNGSGIATTAFESDLVVDALGNPHYFAVVGSVGSDANGIPNYSIQSALGMGMYDITTDNGGTAWKANYIGYVGTLRGHFGEASPNGVDQDNKIQASRTEDGSKVFVSWLDSDTTGNTALDNQNPNLIACGIDIATGMKTISKNFTFDDPLWAGKVLFPTMAPTVLGTIGTYTLPIAISEILTDDVSPCFFHYFQDVQFLVGDFSIALNSDAELVTAMANASPSGDFEPVCFNDTTYLYDRTTMSPSSWAWDFGDGSPADNSQDPAHHFASAGTYTITLITTNSCGNDTLVRTLDVPGVTINDFTGDNVNIAASDIVNFTPDITGTATHWVWDFGDGFSDTLENTSHVYATGGSYTVRLWAWADGGCEAFLAKSGYINVSGVGFSELNKNPFGVQIFPNPSSESVNISYAVPTESVNVKLSIYNTLGAKVADLLSGKQNQGQHNFVWTPGSKTSSTYFCVLDIDGKKSVVSFVNIK